MTLQRTNPLPPDDDLEHNQRRARRPRTARVLTRAPKEKSVLGGVLGGTAMYLELNPLMLRIIFVIVCLLSAGVTAIGYPILWLILPKQESQSQNKQTQGEQPDNQTS